MSTPKIRYLTGAEQVRIVNACPADLRDIVRGALLTGCRYGELAAMRTVDFDSEAGTITVAQSKSGKARHVVLDSEGRTFFAQHTAGRPQDAHIFERDLQVSQASRDSERVTRRGVWGRAQQDRPIKEACKGARIAPAIGFHVLRHTYASRLAGQGVPMRVIADQLGHADTRMTEKHYAHLAPSYVADTVRAALQPLSILAESNVVNLPAAAL